MPEKDVSGQAVCRKIDLGLSISSTTCIKGVFVLLIFLSHFCQYIDTNTLPYFGPYLFLRSILGQLVVAPFLFYSGYGIMEQIKKKGKNYIGSMPKKRIFKTWLHFVLAVVIYLLVSFHLRSGYSLTTILLSFTGWESLGNSNWYIFAILVMYICTYASFKILKNDRAVWACFIFALLYIAIMHFAKSGSWWYDTILCFPAGMLVSCYKKRVTCFMKKRCGAVIVFCLMAFGFRANLMMHELLSVFFCLGIVLLCSYIKIESSILLFLGKHAFEIYILQRIPMMLLQEYMNGYAYMLTCLIVSVVLAVLFKEAERKVDLVLKI